MAELTLQEAAAAVGQITPVILGVLAYFFIPRKDRTKPPAASSPVPPPMGMTVDFEQIAVEALNHQIATLEKQLTRAETDRDKAYDALRANGLPLP